MREVYRLPDLGEGITQAEIVEYVVAVGDKIKTDQIVVRVETDKAVVELPSPFAGTVAELPHEPGDTVNVGDPLLIVETEAAAKPAAPVKSEAPAFKPATPAPPLAPREARALVPASAPQTAATGRVLATPHTRKLARELKVDISAVKGSGPHGRVTDDDVRHAAQEVPPSAPKAPTAAAVHAPATAGFDFEKYGPTRREPLRGVRKRVAEVMVRSVSTIPPCDAF